MSLVDRVAVHAYTTAKSGRQAFPVLNADMSLSAVFAWVAEAVSSSPVAEPIELAAEPIPDIVPVLRSFQSVLDRLAPQTDEGDIARLGDEITSWSEDRARATRLLLDD